MFGKAEDYTLLKFFFTFRYIKLRVPGALHTVKYIGNENLRQYELAPSVHSYTI
jgi:hypothetical protein